MRSVWLVVESVTGHYGGRLRPHRVVGSDRQRDTRLRVDGHWAATLERHAGQPAPTHCPMALAAGGPGQVTASHGTSRRQTMHTEVSLPLGCCEPVAHVGLRSHWHKYESESCWLLVRVLTCTCTELILFDCRALGSVFLLVICTECRVNALNALPMVSPCVCTFNIEQWRTFWHPTSCWAYIDRSNSFPEGYNLEDFAQNSDNNKPPI